MMRQDVIAPSTVSRVQIADITAMTAASPTPAFPVAATVLDVAGDGVTGLRPPSIGQSERPGRIVWHYLLVIVAVHALAALAVIPWLFSWTGLILLVAGVYFFGGLGMNLCYHRLLAHRSFACPTWLERVFVVIALCCMQDAPARWVAAHRIHHNHSDTEPDPHSPLVSFLWSHVGWMLVDRHGLNKISNYERFVRDLLRQPFYLNLERRLVPTIIYFGHGLLYFAAGFVAGFWIGPEATGGAGASRFLAGVQFGLSLLVWGVFLRTVVVWHITWSVNSLTHMFGYRNYDTNEESRNNWLVAILASGEGWHNNHHADPASATNQRRWWEFDPIYGMIRLLELCGLVTDVVRPKHKRTKVMADATKEVGKAA
jgi:stearoyl-CoA desaturase (delta-9 desaturase)